MWSSDSRCPVGSAGVGLTGSVTPPIAMSRRSRAALLLLLHARHLERPALATPRPGAVLTGNDVIIGSVLESGLPGHRARGF